MSEEVRNDVHQVQTIRPGGMCGASSNRSATAGSTTGAMLTPVATARQAGVDVGLLMRAALHGAVPSVRDPATGELMFRETDVDSIGRVLRGEGPSTAVVTIR